MYSQNRTKKKNTMYSTKDISCFDKADSEIEWNKTMKSNRKKYNRKSRKVSNDNESQISLHFDEENKVNNNFMSNKPPRYRSKNHDLLLLHSKRIFDDEIRFPSHFSFGLNLIEDFDLCKRNNLDLIENQQRTNEDIKLIKNDSVNDENVDDLKKKKSNAETKPFSSNYNYSSEHSSVNSYDSDFETKINNKAFLSNIGNEFPCKYKNINSLYKLLKKHFKCKKMNDIDVKLSNTELLILKSIIARKYKNKINLNIKSPFLKDKLNQIGSSNSQKRIEENHKFVFKRCIKYMKNLFKTNNKYKSKKPDMERAFYSHYFQEIADKEDISLECFYHPTNSRSKIKNGPKTINSEYLRNICKNKEFINTFLDYAYDKLKIDYEKVIDIKIEDLIKKWDEMLYSNRCKETIIDEILEYIEKNKKCKLPWNFTEIDEAIIALRKLFKEYVNN